MNPRLKPSPPITFTRRTVTVGLVAFFAVVAVAALGWYTVRSTANEASTKSTQALTQAVRVQNSIIAENTAANRANAVVAHAQCLRGNDGRVLIRRSEVDIVAIIFGAAQSRTPEQQAALGELQRRIETRASALLREVDCDTFAPMPPHPTAAEIASLPKPTPIPPLEGP